MFQTTDYVLTEDNSTLHSFTEIKIYIYISKMEYHKE